MSVTRNRSCWAASSLACERASASAVDRVVSADQTAAAHITATHSARKTNPVTRRVVTRMCRSSLTSSPPAAMLTTIFPRNG